MGTSLRVLIVEESEVEALHLLLELQQGGYEPVHERVDNAAALAAALREKSWDAILCNYHLPGFNGLEALSLFRKTDLDIPFIVVSGMAGEEVAVEVMKGGAHDYILKGHLQRLVPAIERELRESSLRQEHRRMERALRDGERKFRLLVENAPEAIFVHVGGRFAYLNPATLQLFGAASPESLLGRELLDFIPPTYQEIVRERMRRSSVERKLVGRLELIYLRLDGSPVDVEVSAVPFTYEKKRGGLVFVRDISERKRAEEETRRNRESAERLIQEMAVIAEIGRIIGATLNIEEVYERFAAEAKKLIVFDRIAVALNLPERGERCVAYISGMDVQARRSGKYLPLANSINAALLQSRTGMIVHPASVAELTDVRSSLITPFQAGIRSFLCIPLISRNQVIGVLHLQAKAPNLYTDRDLRLAQRIGDQIAGAIANAELFRELKSAEGTLRETEERQRRDRETAERLAREMAVIAEIGRIIGATLNIEEVYERFAAEAKKLIPFDNLMVNLLRPEEKALLIAHASGMDIPRRRRGDRIPCEHSFCQEVARNRRGLILQSPDPQAFVSQFPHLREVAQAGMLSTLAVPLISGDRVIGALVFRSKGANTYSSQDLPLAERIGDQIAGAIANAQLFADLGLAQASLRESETRFRAIFDQAAMGVAELDIQSGRFLSANRRLCEMLDRSEEELKGLTFLQVTHPDDRHLHEGQIARLIAGETRRFTMEKRYLKRDGEVLWVNLAISSLWKPGEKPGRNLIIVQDITDAKGMREEIERRSRQLAALHDTSLDLMAELDLSALLRAVVQRALGLIGGNTCNCYLYEPGEDRLARTVTAGEGLVARKTTRQRGEGLVGVIWETGEPLLINDYQRWPHRVRAYASASPRAMIGAPIRWGGEFLGVLNVMSLQKGQFTPTDVETLGMFATQAAIAIRNARLYKQVEQTAITDLLTGLFNRRGFLQLGEREFDRAMRFGRPLAALLVDIDHFKTVNDRFGHHAGDQVLQALALCLKRNSRGIDVVGRYGGEEFVLLLPDTLPAGAIQIADRLRESIANLRIPAPDGLSPGAPIQVTASIGVAALTPEVRELAFLIDRADRAQYSAKRSGRNRFCLWEARERAIGEAPQDALRTETKIR